MKMVLLRLTHPHSEGWSQTVHNTLRVIVLLERLTSSGPILTTSVSSLNADESSSDVATTPYVMVVDYITMLTT